MHRVKQLGSAVIVGSVMFSAGFGGTLAQSSTDSVDFSPNPDQCNQAPRTIEEVEALQDAGIPASAVGTVAAEDFALPAGDEAPPDVRGGIVETIVQIIACANGGDQLASLGGVTDAMFAMLAGAGVFSIESVTSLPASPVALPEDSQTELLDTREFTVYDDGRVGVLVYYRVPTEQASDPDAVQIALWTFAQEDGRWLLDEMVTGLESQLGDMATPPAG
jgi:hypothetical protein